MGITPIRAHVYFVMVSNFDGSGSPVLEAVFNNHPAALIYKKYLDNRTPQVGAVVIEKHNIYEDFTRGRLVQAKRPLEKT